MTNFVFKINCQTSRIWKIIKNFSLFVIRISVPLHVCDWKLAEVEGQNHVKGFLITLHYTHWVSVRRVPGSGEEKLTQFVGKWWLREWLLLDSLNSRIFIHNKFHKTSRFLSCRSKCLKVALEGKIWNLCVWKMRRWHLLHSGKAIKVLQSVPQNVTLWKMRRGHLLHSCHFI